VQADIPDKHNASNNVAIFICYDSSRRAAFLVALEQFSHTHRRGHILRRNPADCHYAPRA
jgi:hypothetical protein